MSGNLNTPGWEEMTPHTVLKELSHGILSDLAMH